MVKKLSPKFDAAQNPDEVVTRPVPAKRGRPPSAAPKRKVFHLSPARLRTYHNAIQAALAAPRSKSARQALQTTLEDIADRLGPYVHPNYVPAQPSGPAQITVYRVVTPDGAEHTVPTIAAAAALYGCAPNSLKVLLSRGGGKATKRAYHMGNASTASVEKMRVEMAQPEKSGEN